MLPSRRERRRQRTVNAILDAAESHFLADGYEDAKVDAIAADADVAVGSIYNYFGSKDGLYAAVLSRAAELFELYMGKEPALELSPLERILDIAGRLARFAREHPGEMRLVSSPPPARAPAELADALARIGDAMATGERRTAALLEASVRRRLVRPLDARATAAFLWAAWKGALTLGPRAERAAPGRDRELQQLLEAGLRVIVGGLASDDARQRDETVRSLLAADPTAATGRLELHRAAAAGALRERFADLALWTVDVPASPRPSPEAVRARLRARSRPAASAAVGAHPESTPWAYKVFVRRLGMDPDAADEGVEAIALRGAGAGPPRERGLPDDALVIAAAETGVPIVAFDADRLDHALWLREARRGERISGSADALAPGTPVLADDRGPLAVPFGPGARGVEVTDATERIALAALQVKGVPDVSVEQALWTVIEIVRSGA